MTASQDGLGDVQPSARYTYRRPPTVPNLQVRMQPKSAKPHEMTSSLKFLCRRSQVATTVHCILGRVLGSRTSTLPPCPISGLPRSTGLYRPSWNTGGHQRSGLHTCALDCRWEGDGFESRQGAPQVALLPDPIPVFSFVVASWCWA